MDMHVHNSQPAVSHQQRLQGRLCPQCRGRTCNWGVSFSKSHFMRREQEASYGVEWRLPAPSLSSRAALQPRIQKEPLRKKATAHGFSVKLPSHHLMLRSAACTCRAFTNWKLAGFRMLYWLRLVWVNANSTQKAKLHTKPAKSRQSPAAAGVVCHRWVRVNAHHGDNSLVDDKLQSAGDLSNLKSAATTRSLPAAHLKGPAFRVKAQHRASEPCAADLDGNSESPMTRRPGKKKKQRLGSAENRLP